MQNSQGGAVETKTGETNGTDCGPGDDVTVAVDVHVTVEEGER